MRDTEIQPGDMYLSKDRNFILIAYELRDNGTWSVYNLTLDYFSWQWGFVLADDYYFERIA